MKCPHCGRPTKFAGFVSLPPQSIYHCVACDRSDWVAGMPGQSEPRPPFEPQAQQQPQAKLEPEE